MSLYSDKIWHLVKYIPAIFLIWHLYLGLFGGNLGVWIVEIPWLILYSIALGALLKPVPKGYVFLTLLVAANLGWEIRIGYLMLNEIRIIKYFLPAILLIYLYTNHVRFAISKRYASIAIGVFGILLIETAFFGIRINQYKSITGYDRWTISSTGREFGVSDVAWFGSNTVIISALKSRSPMGNIFSLGRLNLTSGEFDEIDDQGSNPAASDDGQWVSYIRKEGWIDKKQILQYVRYHASTDEKETVLRYVNRGTNFNQFMAPSGDKLAFVERADEPVEVLSTHQPQWPVFKWHNDFGQFQGIWMPDGMTVLVRRGLNPYLHICMLDGQVISEIPLPDINIISFKVSPDARYIYAKHSQTYELYYYDLNSPDLGWRSVGSGSAHSYAVGPGGMLIYNHVPDSPDPYMYLRPNVLVRQGLWLYRPGSVAPIRISADSDDLLSISPDGKIIIFNRDKNESLFNVGGWHRNIMLLRQP